MRCWVWLYSGCWDFFIFPDGKAVDTAKISRGGVTSRLALLECYDFTSIQQTKFCNPPQSCSFTPNWWVYAVKKRFAKGFDTLGLTFVELSIIFLSRKREKMIQYYQGFRRILATLRRLSSVLAQPNPSWTACRPIGTWQTFWQRMRSLCCFREGRRLSRKSHSISNKGVVRWNSLSGVVTLFKTYPFFAVVSLRISIMVQHSESDRLSCIEDIVTDLFVRIPN